MILFIKIIFYNNNRNELNNLSTMLIFILINCKNSCVVTLNFLLVLTEVIGSYNIIVTKNFYDN